MLNFRSKLFILLFSLFVCTGCFDFQENLFLKKDGSGTFTFSIDMSKAKSMLALFGEMPKSIESNDFEMNTMSTSKISAAFQVIEQNIVPVTGISNLKTINDTLNLKFGVSFDFKNIAALNKAMNKVFEKDSNSVQEDITYFEFRNKQLIRVDTLNTSSLFGRSGQFKIKNTKEKTTTNSFSELNKLFADVSYTTNYFFEQTIESAKNNTSQLSENLKSVSIKCYPFVVPADSTIPKCSIANTLTFK